MEPLVSIICNTYNQKQYISDAIEGFLKQETDFAYEVLIHDDASTDGTSDIIRKYANIYPNLIFPIIQETNQYSRGISISRTYQFPRARGKYIAICEGDDYWISKNKLQKQVNVLERETSINMCCHSALEVVGETKKKIGKTVASKTERIISVPEVISGGGGYFATDSILCRKSIFEQVPRFFDFFSFDYSMQILGSLDNGIYYLPEIYSAHRYASTNSWTSRVKENPESRIKWYCKVKTMLQLLDEDTKGNYSTSIKHSIDDLDISILYYSGKFKEIKEKYPDCYKMKSVKEKLIINARIYCPILFDIFWQFNSK